MKLCSSIVLIFLIAATMNGTVTNINCASHSSFRKVESGTQDFDEVAENAQCPFTMKVMIIWIPGLKSEIRIVNITCKKSPSRYYIINNFLDDCNYSSAESPLNIHTRLHNR